jgi:hypothetical protein
LSDIACLCKLIPPSMLFIIICIKHPVINVRLKNAILHSSVTLKP